MRLAPTEDTIVLGCVIFYCIIHK